MTPAEIALIISLLQAALTEGKDMYDAAQLKQMADLQVKLQTQLDATAQDRLVAHNDIAARDAALADELKNAGK